MADRAAAQVHELTLLLQTFQGSQLIQSEGQSHHLGPMHTSLLTLPSIIHIT